jgi:hypothetical protein
MKQSLTHLFFGILFVLTVFSIGMSLLSMVQMSAQWPQAAQQSSAQRSPTPPMRKLTGTPVPVSSNPGERPAA